MSRSLLALVAVSLLLGFGCTDDVVPPPVDEISPNVTVVFPPSRIDQQWAVADSTDVYVAARDETGIAEVGVFFSRPDQAERETIGFTNTPISLDAVPDSVIEIAEIPDGWDLYTVHWRTQNVQSGSQPQVFATAVDLAGNVGRSDAVIVSIFNVEDQGPPIPGFRVTPREGTIEDVFIFDAWGDPAEGDTLTWDPVDTLGTRVTVRWDFNGDGEWDVDWDDNANVRDQQMFTSSFPRNYIAILQARNGYFDDPSELDSLQFSVRPIGGIPDPPDGMAFETLSAGTYPRGAWGDPDADLSEFPPHRVRHQFDLEISRYEVSNRFYLDYLGEALQDSLMEFRSNSIFYQADKVPPADSVWLYLDLESSRLFFDIDRDDFLIEPGFDDHPVTGVTWYGANGYAFHYGLRLPTEAEWESAARGDNLSYRYPYGANVTDGDSTGTKRINHVASGDPFEGDRGTNPVGFYNGQPNDQGFETIDSPSPSGLYDVSGNVAEWVNDWFGPYDARPVQSDPQGPIFGTYKVVRGGSYLSSPAGVRISRRDGDRTPDRSFPSIGFRVAYTEIIE